MQVRDGQPLCSSRCARRRRPSTACVPWQRRCSAPPTGSSTAGRRGIPPRHLAHTTASCGCSASCAAGASWRGRCRPRSSSRRSSVRTSGARRRRSPAASPCSTFCARARDASRSSSSSVSKRGGCRAAVTSRRSSPTTHAAISTRANTRDLRVPTRSRATVISSTRHARVPTKRVYLAREAAGDDGSPRSPSPFWDEVLALFPPDDVQRWTRRRALSQLTWPLESAPTERERLRAVALRAPADRAGADAIARPTAGSEGSPRAAGVRATHAADPSAGACRAGQPQRRSASRSSSVSPTAPRSGSSSA